MKTTKKRPRCADEEEDAPDNAEECVVTVRDCVYFSAEVEPKYTVKLIRAMDEASDYALKTCLWPCDARIYLYINSGGGCAFSGLSAMDHIRNNRVPVVTIADGYVASAATFMLLGGAERKTMRNAKILIHQLSTYFIGKYADLLDEVENSKELMESFRRVYADHTNLRGKELDSLLNKELHMNAHRSLECGFVDAIW
jgi:ATP-dependent Clp protease protease subunit